MSSPPTALCLTPPTPDGDWLPSDWGWEVVDEKYVFLTRNLLIKMYSIEKSITVMIGIG